MTYPFDRAIIGGTFGILHVGHKKLLKTAFDLAEFVSIGVTSDEYLRSHKPNYNNYPLHYQRKLSVLSYCVDGLGIEQRRFQITPLNNRYGETIRYTYEGIPTVLIVSEETMFNAQEINSRRFEKGLESLHIHVIPVKRDETGKRISTTRLMQG